MPNSRTEDLQNSTLLSDIQSAVESSDRARQSLLVRRSADLLTQRWSRLPEDSKAMFDSLLSGLLSQVDEEARHTFALRIASLRRAPPRTSALLAQDPSIRVAAIVLMQARSFDDDWLQALAVDCGNQHRSAIARRAGLSARICNVLAQFGDAGVAAALLANPKLALAPETLALLLRHASDSEEVAVRLAICEGLPLSQKADLVTIALRRAQTSLIDDIEIDPETRAGLPERVARILSQPVGSIRLSQFTASMATVGELSDGSVPAARLERWLELRRLEDVLAVLAQQAGLQIDLLMAAYDAEDTTAITTIVCGLDYPWSTLKALLAARSRNVVAPETMLACYSLRKALGPISARRVVRYATLMQGQGAFLAQFSTQEHR